MKLPISQHCSDIGPINSKLQSSTSHSKYLTGKIFRIILCLVNCLFFCPFFALWHLMKILHLLALNLVNVSITCYILLGSQSLSLCKKTCASQSAASEWMLPQIYLQYFYWIAMIPNIALPSCLMRSQLISSKFSVLTCKASFRVFCSLLTSRISLNASLKLCQTKLENFKFFK